MVIYTIYMLQLAAPNLIHVKFGSREYARIRLTSE